MKEFLHLYYLKGRQILITETKSNLDKLKKLRIVLWDFQIGIDMIQEVIKSFFDMGDVDNLKIAMDDDGMFLGIVSIIFKHDVSVNAAVEKYNTALNQEKELLFKL